MTKSIPHILCLCFILLTWPLPFVAIGQSNHTPETADTLASLAGDLNADSIEDQIVLLKHQPSGESTLVITSGTSTLLTLACGIPGSVEDDAIWAASEIGTPHDGQMLFLPTPNSLAVTQCESNSAHCEYQSWQIEWFDGYFWITRYEHLERSTVERDINEEHHTVNLKEREALNENILTRNIPPEHFTRFIEDSLPVSSIEFHASHSHHSVSSTDAKGPTWVRDAYTQTNVNPPFQLHHVDQLPTGSDWWATQIIRTAESEYNYQRFRETFEAEMKKLQEE